MKFASGASSAAVSLTDDERGICTFQWSNADGDWTLVGDNSKSPYHCSVKEGQSYLNSHYSSTTDGWVIKTSGW